jgi:hypothetical protein
MINWLRIPYNIGDYDNAELCDAHLTLQRDLRRLSYAAPLIVILLLTLFALHVRSTIRQVSGEAIGAAFEKRAAVVLPKLQDAAMDVGKRVSPFVADTLERQVDDIVAQFGSRLDREMDLMKETLPGQLEGLMQRKLEAADQAQRQTLVAAFPELKKEPEKVEMLMDTFQIGYTKWAQHKLATTFQRHLVELEAVKHTLNGFVANQNAAANQAIANAAADGKVVAGRRIRPEQLLALWLEILDEALRGNVQPADLLKDPDAPQGAASKGGK